ncbi:MAG: hypothetical protein IPK53_08850 [bacterium]|nr:hypothetical protein [bacterium]
MRRFRQGGGIQINARGKEAKGREEKGKNSRGLCFVPFFMEFFSDEARSKIVCLTVRDSLAHCFGHGKWDASFSLLTGFGGQSEVG